MSLDRHDIGGFLQIVQVYILKHSIKLFSTPRFAFEPRAM